MDHGRSICNVLKSVRKAIADTNGIRYEPAECGFEGECRGTCPACEAELRYIERELSLRRMAGRAVTVAGIALGAAALTACGRDVAQQFEQPKTTVNANENSEMFGIVEESPSFPGGQKALMDYISTHLRNPNPENCAGGRVIVQFVVGKDGTVKDAKVVRGIHPELDAEALRLVENMPKWIPGKLAGEPAEVRYTLPVTFYFK